MRRTWALSLSSLRMMPDILNEMSVTTMCAKKLKRPDGVRNHLRHSMTPHLAGYRTEYNRNR
jgi:hypothetical protein